MEAYKHRIKYQKATKLDLEQRCHSPAGSPAVKGQLAKEISSLQMEK